MNLEKKKPGRPKKKISVTTIETHGIVSQPSTEGDIIELVYGNPIMFKKLFQMYKSFEVSELELYFDEKGLTIYTIDHLEKSKIWVKIDGSNMNLYYCATPLRLIAKRENLERILVTLSKTTYKITFQIREQNPNIFYITINDYEYNSDDIYDIDVTVKSDSIPVDMHDETRYPLQFKLTTKHFKNKINSARKLSQIFTIQKYGGEALQLTFDKSQRGTNWTGVYNDSQKMDMKCTLSPDDIFNVSVVTDYIRPFSNSGIGEIVHISVDRHDPICFSTQLDQKGLEYAATVKIFTEIKDYRN